MTTETLDLKDDMELEEAFLVKRDFVKFLGYVYIEEPPTQTDPGTGKIKLILWPHIMECVKAFLTCTLIVIGKARQVGVSWIVAAYVVWFGSYRPKSVILLFSKHEVEAVKLLAKCKTIWRYLPTSLKTPIVNGEGKDKQGTQTLIEFDNGSTIEAMASTEDAGRSVAASVVVGDEADFHDWLAANYAAVKPTIDSSGGQLIYVSTANKRKMLSLFKGLLRGAPANGWHRVFIPFTARPGRDKAWRERIRNNVPPEALKDMSPDLFIEQEYPESLEEMLRPSRALAFFNPDSLDTMLKRCREPIDTRYGGVVKIWQKPVIGEKFVAFCDVAWGQQGAFSCMPIMNYTTGVQVAEIHGRLEHPELARYIYELCTEYNKAYLGIEANGERDEDQKERGGMDVINKLIAMGYGDRMYHRSPDWRTDERKRGWWTDRFTRPIMLGKLNEFVSALRPDIMCREAIVEMMNAIRDERGRVGAAEGSYFDHVMAWAGLLQIHERAVFSTSGPPVRVTYAWKK